MGLRHHPVHTPSTAQLSYRVGDDAAGTAAVIDPRPDVGVYLELTRRFTHGFAEVRNVVGCWTAWNAAGYAEADPTG